jgi:hypothetical protein
MANTGSVMRKMLEEEWRRRVASKSMPPSKHAKRGTPVKPETMAAKVTELVSTYSIPSTGWYTLTASELIEELKGATQPPPKTAQQVEAEWRGRERTGSQKIYEFNEDLGF